MRHCSFYWLCIVLFLLILKMYQVLIRKMAVLLLTGPCARLNVPHIFFFVFTPIYRHPFDINEERRLP